MASYSSFTKTRSPVLGICILTLTTLYMHPSLKSWLFNIAQLGQPCAADGLPDGQVARGRPQTASTDAASHTVGR
jgi:hypothetical protein